MTWTARDNVALRAEVQALGALMNREVTTR